MPAVTLTDIVAGSDSPDLPVDVRGISLESVPPISALENLKKMHRMGILHGDAIFSLIAQAPIDPLNLMGTLLGALPEGWTFSAQDFAMVRVLSQGSKKLVAAAIQVDLLGSTVITYARNRANQLVMFDMIDATKETGDGLLDKIQRLCDETVAAAAREANDSVLASPV